MIYTRKLTDDGFDQACDSLDTQGEACEAYVLSQACEGCELIESYIPTVPGRAAICRGQRRHKPRNSGESITLFRLARGLLKFI